MIAIVGNYDLVKNFVSFDTQAYGIHSLAQEIKKN